MEKYILIYEIDDYASNGGGVEFGSFDSLEEMDKKANDIIKDERVSIKFAGEIRQEYSYVPKEVVIKIERENK